MTDKEIEAKFSEAGCAFAVCWAVTFVTALFFWMCYFQTDGFTKLRPIEQTSGK